MPMQIMHSRSRTQCVRVQQRMYTVMLDVHGVMLMYALAPYARTAQLHYVAREVNFHVILKSPRFHQAS